MKDNVPSFEAGMRAAQLNRWITVRSALIAFIALATCKVFASEPTPIEFTEHWREVGFGPREYFGPIRVIEMKGRSLYFNGVPLGEQQILDAVRKEVGLLPAPAYYIRVTSKDHSALKELAKGIADVGGCKVEHCLFTVIGRKYPPGSTDAVP